MANIYKPVINTLGYGLGAGTVELFTAADIYRYDVDNRPLEHLTDNDVAIKDALDELVDEILDAHVGRLWPDGTPNHDHNTLDTRLDNMDGFLQEFFEVRNVQYSAFVQFSNFLKERYTSGFMNGPFPDKFIRSNYAMENNEAMPSPFGGFYIPEKANTVQDADVPDEDTVKLLAIETRIEQDGINWRAIRKPLYAHVNGFIVPLLNAHGGTKDALETIDGRRAAGNYGPITIEFPTAPSTGYRFDFAFLEVWQQEVIVGSDWFYPYGSRDWSQWGRETMAVTAGGAGSYNGQIDDRRDLVRKAETGWEWYIFVVDDPNDAVDWSNRIGEGNGTGGFVGASGDPYGVGGTYDPDTLTWTLTFGTPPPDGKYVIASLRTKGFENPDRDNIRGTISFLPNGNYLQIQSRIRVVPGVDYESYPDWFSDPAVEARGPNNTKVNGYYFKNSLNDFHDGSMYHSGDGSATAKVNLGTLDGYIYALPICAWARYNSAPWSFINQNGGLSRPDGGHFNTLSDDQVLDLRPVVLAERYDLKSAAENTLDRILRGDHRTIFGEATTDYDDVGTPAATVGQGTWGVMVPELWRIHPGSGGALETGMNYVRDIGLSTADEPGPGFSAPLAHHDGVRRTYSPQEEVQTVGIYIENVDTSTFATPELVVDYDNATKTITLSTTDTDLSGYAAGANNGVLINDTYPRLYWRNSRQPVKLASQWVGLGTKTAVAVIDAAFDTYETNGTIDGYIDLIYPECTGIDRPLEKTDYVAFWDGANEYQTRYKGNIDGSPDDPETISWKLDNGLEPGFSFPTGIAHSPDGNYIYVCDSTNSRVVKLQSTDLVQVAQWPLPANYPVTFPVNPATQLTAPAAVATDAAGNVYVVDREDHRLVKLDDDLTVVLATFGSVTTPATSPSDTTKLLRPEGVVVDSGGNVYVSDTGMYRLVKINAGLTTIIDYIGDGISGAGANQFIAPSGLGIGTVGGSTFVYVADKHRVVQVDPINMEITNTIGSSNSPHVQSYFRHVTTDIYGFHEDVALNRYAVEYERRLLLRFDASWNLTHTFGQDGVAGWDDDHLQFPRDLIHDPDAGYLYVVDNSHNTGDLSRVLVFDATNLELLGELHPNLAGHMTKGATGAAFYPDAGGANAKLYIGGGDEVARYTLGPVATRSDPSTWTHDWTIDKNTYGGVNQWKHIHDIDVTSDNGLLIVSDVWVGRVSKVDISGGGPGGISHVQVAAYNDWPPYENGDIGAGGCPLGLVLTPDEQGVYVCGGSSLQFPGAYHTIRLVDLATMTVVDEYYDSQNWPPVEGINEGVEAGVPVVPRYAADGNLYITMDDNILLYEMHAGAGDYDGFVPAPGPYPGNPSDIAGDYIIRLSEIPLGYELDLEVPWENVKDVTFHNDHLYVCDTKNNTITNIGADTLLVYGQIGNPATIGRGLASMAGPGGATLIGQNIFFTDTLNNRVMKGYRFYPNIERGTGRMQFLEAVPYSTRSTYQVRYTPYQGVWNRFVKGENAIYGRHYVTDSNSLYITTLGKGTLTFLEDDSGAGIYANMISRIPTVLDTPAKSPRVTDEYLFAPEGLPITEGVTSPWVQLPIINRYPSTAQEMYPLYGGGSRYDFNRFFFVQGPGYQKASSPTLSGVPKSYMKRGFVANGMFPGFDTVLTFPLQTLSIPRMLFGTMVVELEGQGYLLIYTGYRVARGNVLNDGSPISADVYKLYGNPGIKTRY